MRPKDLTGYLDFAIKHSYPVLLTGPPGIGKSDIIKQAAAAAKFKLIISHPVVSDPTDYKGLPFPKTDGTADFLPFGELQQLISAKEKTVYFLDDLGQAPASVQAACMQLLLARRINGHKVSDKVTFLAATNRQQDRAGVTGILEPVKGRFVTIIGLEVNMDDWVTWALGNDMPTELIAFIRFRPELLDSFKPSKDLINTPTPRTIAAVGKQQADGLPQEYEYEVIKGAVGEAFAIEYTAFLKLFRELPSLDEIIMNPHHATVPKEPGALYAVASALAHKMNDQNIGAICSYLKRLPPENSVACMQDAAIKNASICKNRAYIEWGISKAGMLT